MFKFGNVTTFKFRLLILTGLIFVLIVAYYGYKIKTSVAVTPATHGESKPVNFIIRLPWRRTGSIPITYSYGGDWSAGTHAGRDYYAVDFDLDINVDANSVDVYPVASGVVLYAGEATGDFCDYGNFVFIDHGNEYQSFYAHLSQTLVSQSQTVNTSQPIGQVGGTRCPGLTPFGTHLHFVLRRNAALCTKAKGSNGTGPCAGTAVVPEPLIGREVYEGFGLRWPNSVFSVPPNSLVENGVHMGWAGPLETIDIPEDTVSGAPTGSWDSSATANGSIIHTNEPVRFAITNLPTDVKEVRLTAYYRDWSLMDDTADGDVWRILARCSPLIHLSNCQWSNNNSRLSYEWKPSNDDLTSAVGWLPTGQNLVHTAVNTNGVNTQVCISFDVFDLSGNVTYSPGGVQCTPAGGIPSNSSVVYLPLIHQNSYFDIKSLDAQQTPVEALSLREQLLTNLDNTVRTIYIAPADIPTPTPAPGLPADSWYVNYYNDLNLGGGSCNPNTLTLFDNPPQRTFVFKDWGDDAPYNGCNKEFSARIWRRFHLEAGRYNFYLFADDKAKLEVLHAPGGNLIVDQWNATQHLESRNLPAGDYEIAIQYQDSGGAAIIHAWWDGPGYPAPPHDPRDENQWYATFWPNTSWFWDPFIAYNDGNPLPLNKEWGDGGAGYGLQSDNFSSKYERIYQFTCGEYRFVLNADDYAELDVWDLETNTLVHQLVVTQANNEVRSSNPVHLLGKKYDIKVKHKEYSGGARLYVNWLLETPCPTPTPTLTPTWTPTKTPAPPTDTPTPTHTPTPAQPSCNTITQIPQLECKALEAFYSSTDQVGETDNWFTTYTPCDTWAGIVCHNNHVTQLLLDDWYIHGTIAPELGNLTQLEILDLADNYALAGSIPPELGKLASLRILRLDRNNLTGSIPSELGNLTKLEELSLYTNQLNGALPTSLSNLRNVKLFWFYDTTLCIPPDSQIQNWLNGIVDVQATGACNAPPAMPSSVQAFALNSSQIQITWVDASHNENQFTINEGSTSFTVPANTTSFVHSGLGTNTFHCYSLNASNEYGSSEWTEWSCTATVP